MKCFNGRMIIEGSGWDHIEGDIDVPYLTERESFRDALLNSSVFL
jgi:hypothetical protein